MIWFALVDIPYKAIPQRVVTRTRLFDKRPSIGYFHPSISASTQIYGTAKVHPDNLVRLKLAILKHLPVLGTKALAHSSTPLTTFI